MKRVIISLVILGTLSTPVAALGNALPNKGTARNPNKEAVSEVKMQNKQDRCEIIEQKINFRISQYEQNRNKHYTAFQGIKERVENLEKRFEKRNCDVSGLKASLAQLDILIEEFAASFRDWQASMQAAREFSCDESRGEYAKSVQSSKLKVQNMQKKSIAIRTHFNSVIQPELKKAYDACKATPRPSATPSTSN